MIVTKDRGVWNLLFNLKGSIVPDIASKLVISGGLGVVACILQLYQHPLAYDFTPFTVFGVAISIFVGFRSNACYARWWEARGQWGKQIIAVRNLGHIVMSVAPEAPEAMRIMKYASAHSHLLRNQLRGDVTAIVDANVFLCEEEICELKSSPNPADKILYFAGRALYALKSQDVIDSMLLSTIHKHLSELGEVQGACERLANTPVPFPYTLLVHRTTCLFLLLAPFAIVKTAGWFTPLINTIIAYVFLGLDELAHQLEHPFSTSVQALPLTAMCRTIDISTAVARGETPPRGILPDNDILM
jgi:putative membrane protein